MNEATRQRLNAVNREFYETTADEFDASRARPWQGWTELVRRVADLKHPLAVLDVGCGNGRFAGFLRTTLGPQAYRYIGIDASAGLLGRARAHLGDDPNVALVRADFIAGDGTLPLGPTGSATGLATGRFALVALFGVLHHVPGRANRRRLLRELAVHLAPGGYLALSNWRFDHLPRFAKRTIPWDDPRATQLTLDPAELEPGDHLLAWGSDGLAYRYCHLVDDTELAALIAPLGLTTAGHWRAEGATGELNEYVLLRA